MANIEINGEVFAVNPQNFSVLSLLSVLGIEGGDADKIAQNFQDRLTRTLDEDFVALLQDYLPDFADRYVGVGNSGRYRLRQNGEEILANLIVALLAPLQAEVEVKPAAPIDPAPIDSTPIALESSSPKGFADKKPVTKLKTPQPLVAAPQQLTPVAANTTLGFENLTQEQLRAILQMQSAEDQMEELEG